MIHYIGLCVIEGSYRRQTGSGFKEWDAVGRVAYRLVFGQVFWNVTDGEGGRKCMGEAWVA